MTLNCKVCNKEYCAKPVHIRSGRSKYCSVKCKGAALVGKYIGNKSPAWKEIKQISKVICLSCGKEFTVPNSRIRKGEGKYCSWACYGVATSKRQLGKNNPGWKGGLDDRTCGTCGKEFKANKSEVRRGGGKFCSTSCNAINNIRNRKYTGTGIEVIMEKELMRRCVSFKKQYAIFQSKTVPDFFIYPNICVYCDGDYWHNLPKQKIIDERQKISLNLYGYRVYRFWGKDINKDVVSCVDSIKELKE